MKNRAERSGDFDDEANFTRITDDAKPMRNPEKTAAGKNFSTSAYYRHFILNLTLQKVSDLDILED